MGKGARSRRARAAEEASGPELIVVEDRQPRPPAMPLPPPESGRDPEDTSCMVKGCPHLALARHEGPNGVVWLCGRCDMTARRNLAAEAARQKITEDLVELHRPMVEHYARLRQRAVAR